MSSLDRAWSQTRLSAIEITSAWNFSGGQRRALLTAHRRTGVAATAVGGQSGEPPRYGRKGPVQARYYISSLDAPAERLLETVRTHWSTLNFSHWSLDVTFGEDQCRIRKDHAPQNMATLRQISHNLLKRETRLKAGIQGKRLQAGWREDYPLEVLRS